MLGAATCVVGTPVALGSRCRLVSATLPLSGMHAVHCELSKREFGQCSLHSACSTTTPHLAYPLAA